MLTVVCFVSTTMCLDTMRSFLRPCSYVLISTQNDERDAGLAPPLVFSVPFPLARYPNSPKVRGVALWDLVPLERSHLLPAAQEASQGFPLLGPLLVPAVSHRCNHWPLLPLRNRSQSLQLGEVKSLQHPLCVGLQFCLILCVSHLREHSRRKTLQFHSSSPLRPKKTKVWKVATKVLPPIRSSLAL